MAGADPPVPAASAGDEGPRGGRPVRLALMVVAAWLCAIVAARLLLAGGVGWLLFAALLPVLVAVLARWLGLGPAIALAAIFAAATLALRAVLATPRLGWGVLLLAPVLALSGWVALRVVAALLGAKSPREE